MLWRIRTSPGIGKALEAGGEGSSDVVPALADPPYAAQGGVETKGELGPSRARPSRLGSGQRMNQGGFMA
jgi:hypothetical protein